MLVNRDFVWRNMKFRQTKLQKWISHTKGCKSWFCHMKRQQIWCQKKDKPRCRVHPIICCTTETVDMLVIAIFEYITVYNHTRTSKQKFPFVSEAKEGYLSIPTMSYSCMDISGLRHTKSLTKVVPSYKITGFHITAPILERNNRVIDHFNG